MTDRTAALAALRPSRSSTLPPPPSLQPPSAGDRDRPAVSDRSDHETSPGPRDAGEPAPVENESAPAHADEGVQREARTSSGSADGRRGRAPGSTGTAGGAVPSTRRARTRFDELVANPVDACRTMGMVREGQPSKPLNVDLTPDLARSFDDRCREMRLKKKDVVELLLRAWLDELEAHRPPNATR